MKRRHRVALLALLAVPALTGWPLAAFGGALLAGAEWGWLGYGAAVHLALRMALGRAAYGGVLALAALAAIPVVYGGATVSWLLWLSGFALDGPTSYSPHYLKLCLTMLSVIPLALGLVSQVPLLELETRLLRHPQGVSALERRLLIALRVFSHVVFNVLPTILEVLREEGRLLAPSLADASAPHAAQRHGLRQRWRQMATEATHVALEAICAAVRYLPLWAVEIAQLPQRQTRRGETTHGTRAEDTDKTAKK